MQMRAARIHRFNQPLELDEVPVPEAGSNQVLLKVAGAGMCRSDYQLLDGYFRQGLPVELPFIPGHEVAGYIAACRCGGAHICRPRRRRPGRGRSELG